MKKYDHLKLEQKWQTFWEKNKVFHAKEDASKPKFYSLIEFPYPSGDGLHVGHPRPYIGMDVISRKKRMEGYNVLYPIGWDAFGLPTENYAIKTGKDPRVVTKENTDTFRRQIKSLGISFDWSREVNTTDPKYYKWTQWLFLQFLKHDLAYKAKMSINWCLSCKIGLANEEVVNGNCERCGGPVEKREKEQWMLAITKYADRLHKDLDDVDYLPQIKLGQRNWIGRSEGAEIQFPIQYNPSPTLPKGEGEKIPEFIQSNKDKKLEEILFKLLDLSIKNKKRLIISGGWAVDIYAGRRIRNHNDIDGNILNTDTNWWKGQLEKIGFKQIPPDDSKKDPSYHLNFIKEENEEQYKIDLIGIGFDDRGIIYDMEWGKPDSWGFSKESIIRKIFNRKTIEIFSPEVQLWLKIYDREEDRIDKIILTHPLTPSQREGEFGYYTTDPKTWRALQDRALEMRKNPTDAEKIMWEILRRDTTEHHFRRQHIIGRFIVDFVCLEKGIVVEIDGDIHDYRKDEDKERTEILNQMGFEIIRFTNDEVIKDKENVLEKIIFKLNNISRKVLSFGEDLGGVELNSVKVFTTRPDTIFGATYLVLAPEHPMVHKLKSKIANWGEAEKYIKESKNKTEIERLAVNKTKTGVEIKGVKAINPATKEEISIWVADYVLASYGTGAIMAVPAHDARDLEFAKKYNLPIRNVIEPVFIDKIQEGKPFVEREAISVILKHWKEDKYLVLKWKNADWFTFITGGIERDQTPEGAAIAEILEETGYLHPQFVQSLPKTHAKFYHVVKKENRFAHFYNFYFELKDGEKVERHEKEGKAKHEPPMWLTPEEVKKVLTAPSHRRDWQYLKEGGFAYEDTGILANSGEFTGMDSEEAKKKIIEFVGGREKVSFKLRDWVFSRQRYWGEPIPVIICEHCALRDPSGQGLVPVPEEELPVELPKVKNYQPTDSGESPLANISKWVNVKCPKCKRKARRETDTMPNWAGSSWYFLAYTFSKKAFRGPATTENWKLEIGNLNYWTPVDWYNGGMEHTTLHLLYSRFWHKFLYDLKLVPTSEPYLKRTAHGLIMASNGEKMSKSRGNVINPDDIVKRYGADTLRVYEMFMGPFDQAIAWSEEAIIGPRRFLERVWKIGEKKLITASDIKVKKLLNATIKKVTEDIEAMRFNTAISSLMILSSEMYSALHLSIEDFKKFLQILCPFAPHLAEELWQEMGEKDSISRSAWPKWDPALIEDEEVKIAVQVNGKVRSEITVQRDADENIVREKALLDEKILKYTKGANPKKIIYVKNRLINILTN